MKEIILMRMDDSITIAKVIPITIIKSFYPLGTTDGISYNIFPSR